MTLFYHSEKLQSTKTLIENTPINHTITSTNNIRNSSNMIYTFPIISNSSITNSINLRVDVSCDIRYTPAINPTINSISIAFTYTIITITISITISITTIAISILSNNTTIPTLRLSIIYRFTMK